MLSDPDASQGQKENKEDDPLVAQDVSYRLTIIDKVTDVTNAMNINGAFLIRYDGFDAKGKGDFIDTSKVKESDVSFMASLSTSLLVRDNTDLVVFHDRFKSRSSIRSSTTTV